MAFGKKAYSGITNKTPKHLQLDAGAFFIGFEVGTDTYASAKAAGKCLGATQGGGSFTAKPTLRQIDVDGAVGRVKGLTDIETWEVSMSATLLETTVDNIKAALVAAVATKGTGTEVSGNGIPTNYTQIKGKAGISDEDYISDITWIGCLSGSTEPIIIQIKNALNEDGLNLSFAPKSEGKVALNLYSYNSLEDFESDEVNPAFYIYIPDVEEALSVEKA